MTAKRSLALHIGLDCVLIAICATLFSKNVISLMYHEVVGLVLMILFVVHVVFNRKWVSRVFSGKMKTGRSKATLVVNALLILSWVVVMVTGVLVSKKLFPFQVSSLNPLHFFSAALALVMTGIHFGLHWNYFWGWMGKRIRIPKVVAVVLCFVILAFGGYRVVTSSFGRWVAAPFTAHEEHGERGERQTAVVETDPSSEGETTDPVTGREGDAVAAQGQRGSHGQQPFSLTNLLYTIATWFSILFLFAAITHGVESRVSRKTGKV
ncbi:MAG: DUF4405 domain-containing protein [Clostridia bacterium]|nr:DUF4405 domain-containing protein [Clostridia bacterium]MBQ6373543.1 DUF4405 domain-containing protein [Clostridia bacterium]